jgi:hypothetical protein
MFDATDNQRCLAALFEPPLERPDAVIYIENPKAASLDPLASPVSGGIAA